MLYPELSGPGVIAEQHNISCFDLSGRDTTLRLYLSSVVSRRAVFVAKAIMGREQPS